jgi:prophage antirepressor-like protein
MKALTYDFDGRPVRAHQYDGKPVFTFADIYRHIGFTSKREAQRLYSRHKAEFTADEVGVVKLTTPGGTQRTTGFTPLGAHHLGMLAHTDQGAAFRMWIVRTFLKPALDNPGTRLVTVEQFTAAMQQVEARYIGQITALTEMVKSLIGQNVALSGAISIQASSAGKLLSYIAHSPEAKAALDQARDLASGQGRIAFPELDRLNGENGTAV